MSWASAASPPVPGWLVAPPPGVGSTLLFTFVSVCHFFPRLCDPRRCQVGQRLSNVPCAVPCHRASWVSLQERLSHGTFFLSHAFLDYLCINFFIRTLLLLHLCHLCKNLVGDFLGPVTYRHRGETSPCWGLPASAQVSLGFPGDSVLPV